MYDKAIKITWKAFSNPEREKGGYKVYPVESLTFNAEGLFENLSDFQICELVFQDTNLYQGEIWDKIKDNLPQDRSHTALSVGDEVTIYDFTEDKKTKIYRCSEVGFTLVDVIWELNPRKKKLQEV